MYGMSGAGGSSASMGHVQGGQASSSASTAQNEIASQGMALQLAKLASEIKVNESVANVNNASASKQGSETKTIEDSRSLLLENMRQAGIEKWLQNEFETVKLNNQPSGSVRNAVLDWYVSIDENSRELKLLNEQILKTIAETENINLDSKLVNHKVNNYLAEFALAVKNSDSQAMTAAAAKLQAEFNTGTDVNWKNIGEVFIRLLSALK